jgi:hypothetical protein
MWLYMHVNNFRALSVCMIVHIYHCTVSLDHFLVRLYHPTICTRYSMFHFHRVTMYHCNIVPLYHLTQYSALHMYHELLHRVPLCHLSQHSRFHLYPILPFVPSITVPLYHSSQYSISHLYHVPLYHCN